MAARQVPINGAVLKWAMDEGGISPEELAAKIKVPVSTVDSWLNDRDDPTRGELTRLASALRRPPSVLLLADPPSTANLPPNLRRSVGRGGRPLSDDELREVRRARRLQRLVSWLARDGGTPSADIPPIAVGTSAFAASTAIREWLGVTDQDPSGWDTAKIAFDDWRTRLENRRVLVMQLRLGRE
ncbi:MAG: XRE family transcriptional regulator [Chloroflexi bacterium]|nr:XRE family transcriptional regulator [Chloroflexota bacterium]